MFLMEVFLPHTKHIHPHHKNQLVNVPYGSKLILRLTRNTTHSMGYYGNHCVLKHQC
jgi:hypothetical protein